MSEQGKPSIDYASQDIMIMIEQQRAWREELRVRCEQLFAQRDELRAERDTSCEELRVVKLENKQLRDLSGIGICNRCGKLGGVNPTPIERMGNWKGRLCLPCRMKNPDGEYERPPAPEKDEE